MEARLSAPISVDLNVTNRCNLRCAYCSATPGTYGRSQELTLKEIDRLLRDIDRMGVFLVRFAGGEPLARRDFRDIIGFAGRHGFSKILMTNGALLTATIARDLAGAGFNSVALSVDGPNANSHDKSRGQAGAYAGVLQAIASLQRHGVAHTAMVTITRDNCDHLIEIIESLVALDFSAVNLIALSASGHAKSDVHLFPGRAQWAKSIVRLTRWLATRDSHPHVRFLPPHEDPVPHELYYPLRAAGLLDLLGSVWGVREAPTEAMSIGCAAGKTQLTVFENGDVFGCDLMRDNPAWRAGSIRESSLQAIWTGSTVFDQFRGLRKVDLVGPCGSCPSPLCGGGCRASAFGRTGNSLGSDTTCMTKHLHG